MSLGNTTLISHGIQNDLADLRIHIAPITRYAFAFLPFRALDAIKTGKYDIAPAGTNGLVTAKGYLIPPEDIYGCKGYEIPDDLLKEANFHITDTTSDKGKKAEFVGIEMINLRIIPIIVSVNGSYNVIDQVNGIDAFVEIRRTYQFKCDYKAGPRSRGGTGFLYIQTEECNPYRQY